MATLILLHGFAATNFTWRDVEGPLADAGHEVIALQRPFVPLREAISLTKDELDLRNIDEAVLIGHSAGAEVALHLTALKPERVCGLVLSAPVAGGGPPALARAIAGAPLLRNVAPGMLRVGMRAGLPFALRQTWSNKERVTDEVVEGFRTPLLQPGVAESLWKMTAAHTPMEPDWQALRATPVLVIKGDTDKWTTPVPLPKAETVTYERCGHLPHEECAERFVADVLRFVEQVG